ncbi:hypothetical protein BH24DEI2_BH24DEI2_29020 [soil metagenome]
MSQAKEKENLKRLFEDARDDAMRLYRKLSQLYDFLESDVDRTACQSILTDLMWAAENCTVIGLHQIGKKLDDNMGYPAGEE